MNIRLWLPDLLRSASCWLLVVAATWVAIYLTTGGDFSWLSALAWGMLLLIGLSPITTGLAWRLPPTQSRAVTMPIAYGLFCIGCLVLRWIGLDLFWSATLVTLVAWGGSWKLCNNSPKEISYSNPFDGFALAFIALWSSVLLMLLLPLLKSVALSLIGQGPLLGWSDMVLLANFILQLGTPASLGEPIPNPLLHSEAVLPYHFGAYIPAALAYRLGVFQTPLEAVVAVAIPSGLILIGCSLAGVGQGFSLRLRLIGGLVTYTVTVAAYWLFLLYNQASFWDPAWLLMTAPSTIHAAAILSSFLALYSQLQGKWPLRRLLVLSWILTVGMKIQVAWYTLPMYVALFCHSVSEINIKGKHSPLQRLLQAHKAVFDLVTGLALTAVIMWLVVELSGYSRNYVQDFTQLGLQVAEPILFLQFLESPLSSSSGDPGFYQVLLAALSQGVIAGFSFWAALAFVGILSFRAAEPTSGVNTRLLQAGSSLLIGSFIATLLSPITPWDAGEFQNRAWPVLWVAAMQLWMSGVAARSRRKTSQQAERKTLLIWLFLTVLATLLMTHRASLVGKIHIQTPLPEWTELFYPTQFTPQTLKIAKVLKDESNSARPLFFVYPLDTDTLLNDQAAVLTAVSGRLPYYSRLGMTRLLYSVDRNSAVSDEPNLPESIAAVLPIAQANCPNLNGQVIRVESSEAGVLDIVCLPQP